jgi:hypothetical protein
MSQTPTPSELIEIRRVKAMIAGATYNTDCFIGPQGPAGPAGPTGPAGPAGGAVNLPSTPTSVVFIDQTGTISFGISSFTFTSTNGLFVDTIVPQAVYPKYINFSTQTTNPYTTRTGTLWFNSNTNILSLDSNPIVITPRLVSTVEGLGTTGYVSTATLVSTVQNIGVSGFASTVAGLGTADYISSLSLVSSVRGLGTTSYVSTLSLTSAMQGMGTLGFLSSVSGTPAAPRLGNVLIVDAVNGNNSTASPGGLPYLNVQNAVAAATSGQTVWILPGTYTLSSGITIPTGVSIRGASTQTTILQMTPTTTGTHTMITMGAQTRLEDVTVNFTTSTTGASLIGVYFPLSTSVTAKIRTCVINVSSTAADSTFIYGIFSDGTTTNPKTFQSSAAIRAITTNVTGNVTGRIRGWYFTGAIQFSCRDTIIKADGTGSAADIIGVEATNSASFIIIKTSSVSGTTYDIQQPAGLAADNAVIQLNATDLINANANANGFTVNTEPSHLYFSGIGNWGSSTHYMFPGTVTVSELASNPVGIPFPQKCIVFEALITCQPALTTGMTATLKLYKKATDPTILGTLFATLVASAGSSSVRLNNFSASFNPLTDFLQVQMVTSNLPGNQTVIVALAVY